MREFLPDTAGIHLRSAGGAEGRREPLAGYHPCRRLAPALAGLLFAVSCGLAGGCGVREESYTVLPDSTLHYASKLAEDVDVRITFAATAGRDGAGTRFFLRDGARVFAFADVLNPAARGTERSLPFHLAWVNPNGLAVFTRDGSVDPTDEDPVLRSSFTLDPDRRQPGRYSLQVYLHRELIARKFFEAGEEPEDIRAEITLAGQTPDPETGAYMEVRDTFTIGEDDRVRAHVDLVNLSARGEAELEFTLEWIDPDGDTVFRRSSRVDPAQGETGSLSGSMSLAPGSRESGQYTLRVWLFGNMLVAERAFTLLGA